MVKSAKPDLVDEHYYLSAADFDNRSHDFYDKYPRGTDAPLVFGGEWAAYEEIKPWEEPSKLLPRTPSMKCALADAAWMSVMERNADIVIMQCYAPMFVNINPGASQWRPNLIGYDGLTAFGSPSYYTIKMFSQNHGDNILKGSFTGVARRCQASGTLLRDPGQQNRRDLCQDHQHQRQGSETADQHSGCGQPGQHGGSPHHEGQTGRNQYHHRTDQDCSGQQQILGRQTVLHVHLPGNSITILKLSGK